MKKRLLSTLLALCMVLVLLPVTAQAAEPNLPDWYFLFAIFKSVDADVVDKDGVTTHTKYTMTQEEVDVAKENAKRFESYMNQIGVMRAHVDVVEIDEPVTELEGKSSISSKQATVFLQNRVDLDRYDHVTCIASLNVHLGFAGIHLSDFESGAGHSFVNFVDREYTLATAPQIEDYPTQVYVHEFLHFMEHMSERWGMDFDMHTIRSNYYTPTTDEWKTCYTDIILNRFKEDAELGTGVSTVAWQYPPHVFRTMHELTIPDGVTAIGNYAFQHLENLEQVTIPSSVASIGDGAFAYCSSLTSAMIFSNVTSIGAFTFRNCDSLKSVFIPASITSVGRSAFFSCGALSDVYYSGTAEQWSAIDIDINNSALTKATVHYNRIAFSDVPANEWYANAVAWAVANGVTSGTGDGKFSPGQTCSQAQILTFLWRAKGEPKPAAAVNSNEYYAKAAQWAKEQGLTDNFSANAPCTRAMAVTYLWKLAGSPVEGASSFTDVPAGSGYAQAVAWAVKNGVTSGTGNGRFSPDTACTRAQIVTFLYRALV